MSRVGKKPIEIPSGIKVTIEGNTVSVEGPKGKLEYVVPVGIKVHTKDGKVIVERPDATKEWSALHGLTRTIIANLITGVKDGYKKQLEIKGVGFKAQVQGSVLVITLGFSHLVRYPIPEGITVATAKPTELAISGIDKVKVGEVAAEIRDFFKPEPYTGKGIMYVGEHVRRKAGKTVVK